MLYFIKPEILSSNNVHNQGVRVKEIKEDFRIRGLFSSRKPCVGDVIKVFFSKEGSAFFFEGFCYKTKLKNFLKPNSSFGILNKIKNSTIAFIFSYFTNLVLSCEFLNFKKRLRKFSSSKVYNALNLNKKK